MREKCELLAPAGGMRQLYAAVENGADAIYIGGRLFNARMNADNFSDEEISEAVAYAHVRNVKIYVTMNTLIADEEMERALDYACILRNLGVDALIVQDLGFANLLKKMIPDFPLHLSTQGTVYNLSGVKMAEKLGFARVVLARELSLSEISEITKNSSLPIEVFVHGALCICYSGQCQMSHYMGGRSGNRGLCAQPCRLPYGSKYPLSPKDLCTIDILGELIDAGVYSFKIEGRMKSAEYVATVTRIYRKYMDIYLSSGNYSVDEKDREALLQIFNRGGFTQGYLHGNPGESLMSGDLPKHQGIYVGKVVGVPKVQELIDVELEKPLSQGDGVEIRNEFLPGNVVTYMEHLGGKRWRIGDIKGKVQCGDGLFKITDGALMLAARESFEKGQERVFSRKVSVNAQFMAALGMEPQLTLTEEETGISVHVVSTVKSEKAINRAIQGETIERQLRKTGNTPFEIASCEINISDDISIPLSVINAIRREALEELQKLKETSGHGACKGSEIVEAAMVSELTEQQKTARISKVSKIPGVTPFAPGRRELYFFDAKDVGGFPLNEYQPEAVFIPLYDFMENRELVEGLREKTRAEIIPYISNVSRGFLDKYIEENFDRIVAACGESGISIGNLGWIREFAEKGVKVFGDFGLNIYNRYSAEAVSEMGAIPVAVSQERETEGTIQMMISEHAFPFDKLTDRKDQTYSVRIINKDKSIILKKDEKRKGSKTGRLYV